MATSGPIDQATRAAPHRGLQSATQTLTFLFTDVEGSTRLWEQAPDAMKRALERHDAIVRQAIGDSDGTVVKTTGDGYMAVFGSAGAALLAGIAAQRRLLSEPWPEACAVRVRMGLHTGEAEIREGDYFGPVVNRTARIMAAGHGGQILMSGSTTALVADSLPEGVTLLDLGEHRLKDLERAERLFQPVHPELTNDFPPLSTLDLRPNNLPTQASAFVGRDAELDAIRDLLADGGDRLITLTGPGGTGKTRLALRAAADAVERFRDGVFFVDLSSARDADTVVALIAGAVGGTEVQGRSPLDELKRQLRPQRTLLVLDNFEQVTIAGPTLADLLADAPDVKALVTSREALRVRGEHLFSVPPLSLPSTSTTRTSAADLSQFEAIQLFVARARAVRPDFHLTDDNAAAVAEICRRLDGLPLAIELATARLTLFSPEALRDRLGSRLQLLRSGPRDLPARQQTLRATIEWSYLLLEPAEQRLLELLSIFAGAQFEAVEAVARELEPLNVGDFDVLDGLASLLGKSLVRQSEPIGTSSPRIVMLETIREFSAERLAERAEFLAAGCRAHATHFAAFARAAWEAATSRHTDPLAGGLVAETENLRIAWRYWVAAGDRGRLNELADCLWHVYEARGWYHATIDMINDQLQVLSAAPATPDRWQQELTLRSSLPRALTLLRGYTGEVEDAYGQALALFEGHPELPEQFPVLRSLTSFYGFRGEFEKGAELARRVIRLAEVERDPAMLVDGNVLLGSYVAFSGDLKGGLEHLDRAIQIFETEAYPPRRLRLGNDLRITALTTSGFLLWLLGFPDRALERAERAVALATRLDHPYSVAYALYHAGFLHVWRREPDLVRERALGVIGVVETNDFPIWRALGMCLLGASTSALGDPERGVAEIRDGIDQYQGLRTPPIFWPLIRSLEAEALVEAGRAAEALPLIGEAIGLGGPDSESLMLFHVIHGDAWRRRPDADLTAARAAYEYGYTAAARSGLRMPQLRSAMRLLEISSPEERAQSLARVRAVYESLTEGFGTRDVIEAREMLGEATTG